EYRTNEVAFTTTSVGLKTMTSLVHRPTHVAALRNNVDLLPEILTDIGRDQATVGSETEAPRVTQTVRPYFGPGAALSNEGIVFGDAILASVTPRVDVNAEHRAQQCAQPL